MMTAFRKHINILSKSTSMLVSKRKHHSLLQYNSIMSIQLTGAARPFRSPTRRKWEKLRKNKKTWSKFKENWIKWTSCLPRGCDAGYGGCKCHSLCRPSNAKCNISLQLSFLDQTFTKMLNLKYKRKWDNPSVHLLAQITCFKLLHLCNLFDPPIVNSQRGPKPTCLSICDVTRWHKRKVFDAWSFQTNF